MSQALSDKSGTTGTLSRRLALRIGVGSASVEGKGNRQVRAKAILGSCGRPQKKTAADVFDEIPLNADARAMLAVLHCNSVQEWLKLESERRHSDLGDVQLRNDGSSHSADVGVA